MSALTKAEAAVLLEALGVEMSELSEECWCAGWLTGTEEALPALCHAAVASGLPQRWGQDQVPVATARRLVAMAERLGSWADWSPAGFVPYTPSTASPMGEFIVELEPGVWLAAWLGDPGRTLVQSSARHYTTKHGASTALGMARRYRPFPQARVLRTVKTARG